MFELDEYKIYRGRDIRINQNFLVSIPTLNQIEEFGEQRYFSAVHNLNSCGADLKWQLWDYCNQTDYTKIEDYDLFLMLISQMVSSKKVLREKYLESPDLFEQEFTDEELDDMLINPLELTLKYSSDGTAVDLADFGVYYIEKNNQNILWNEKKDITIDRMIYHQIVDAVRKIHGFKRNNQLPANERTKMDLIEDARDEAMLAMSKPFKSVLLPLTSTLKVKTGCFDRSIYDMNISEFFYDIRRIEKVQDATLLLQGAYTGFGSLKGIDKNRLDMFGDI